MTLRADLKGNTAIIGGCTKGIGKAIAEKFAENGADLVLLARNGDKLERLAADLKKRFERRVWIIVADFDVPDDVNQQVGEFLSTFKGTVDIIVNNVGGPMPTDVQDMTSTEMLAVIQRHIICSHTLAMHFLPSMKNNCYGRVINIVGTVYHTPYPGLALTSLRASEVSWSKALSIDVAEYGITVNNILPGPTDTDELEEIIKILALKKGQSFEDFRASVINSVPVKRFAGPEEIATAALYLASKDASFVTGTNLTVDGGFTPSI